jgi:hypothetical protein
MRASSAFDSMRRSALCLVFLVLAAQACVVTAEKKIFVTPDTGAEDDTTPPGDTTGGDDTGDGVGEDITGPADTTGPSKEEWVIGPDGGTFRFDGGARLIVPAGAFPQEITVLIGIQEAPALPEEILPLTAAWIIPDLEDLTFVKPVVLVLPLLGDLPTELPEGVTWDQVGGFTQPLGGEDWTKLPASIDLVRDELSIPTTHFSLFFGGLGGGSGSACTPTDEICNGLDDDCDGAIDQGACVVGEACFMASMCASGTCAWVYGGDHAVCAETTGGCVILDGEDMIQVADEETLCTGATTYRQCLGGALTESQECAEGVEGTFLCDAELQECAGECAVDGDCVDEDLCDGGKVCQAGVCADAGVPVECPEDTDCTTYTCNGGTGVCDAQAINTDGPCDDGDACTSNDTCLAGACVPGDKKECSDGNDCTADTCDPGTGVCGYDAAALNGEACDDGDLCTETDTCAAGVCEGTDKDCDDLNDCTADSCTAATGSCANDALTGETCDDGDACTEADACTGSGTCAGVLSVDCDDLNDCTIDTCNPLSGSCLHSAAALGSDCSYPDPSAGEAAACYPSAQCDASGACQPGLSICDCVEDGDCPDDGDLCNGVQTCNTASFPYTCVDGDAVECGAGGTCFELVCEPASGACVPSGINDGGSCDDGDVCTSATTCAGGACTGGEGLDCDDGDPCTMDGCDPVDGCTHTDAPALPCDDGDDCTTDTCSPDGSACLFVDIPGCCATAADCGGLPCNDGLCCVPVCDDGEGGVYECGDDGCGGTCGDCTGSETCNLELHQCICDTCCQDSTECGALEICMDPGDGNPLCTSLTPLFQANFDDEAAGTASAKFTYSASWPSYSPGWVVYDASGTPEFANSPSQSLRYNKYKSNGWMEFAATLPGGAAKSYLSFLLLCPAGITPNWTMTVKGDGGTLFTVASGDVCGDNTWHHLSAPVTSLGAGSHTFRFELTNEAFGTIYMDDVVILAED